MLVEHDPALFDGAETMIPQIAGMLREAGRESLVIPYSPTIDRPFSLLVRQADRIIEISPADTRAGPPLHRRSRSPHNDGIIPCVQRTLEVS